MIPGTKTSTLHLINKISDFPSHKSILCIKKEAYIAIAQTRQLQGSAHRTIYAVYSTKANSADNCDKKNEQQIR